MPKVIEKRAPIDTHVEYVTPFWEDRHPAPRRYHDGIGKEVGVGWERHHWYPSTKRGRLNLCQEAFHVLHGTSTGIKGTVGKGCDPEVFDYTLARKICEKSMKEKKPVMDCVLEVLDPSEMMPSFVRAAKAAPKVIIVSRDNYPPPDDYLPGSAATA